MTQGSSDLCSLYPLGRSSVNLPERGTYVDTHEIRQLFAGSRSDGPAKEENYFHVGCSSSFEGTILSCTVKGLREHPLTSREVRLSRIRNSQLIQGDLTTAEPCAWMSTAFPQTADSAYCARSVCSITGDAGTRQAKLRNLGIKKVE